MTSNYHPVATTAGFLVGLGAGLDPRRAGRTLVAAIILFLTFIAAILQQIAHGNPTGEPGLGDGGVNFPIVAWSAIGLCVTFYSAIKLWLVIPVPARRIFSDIPSAIRASWLAWAGAAIVATGVVTTIIAWNQHVTPNAVVGALWAMFGAFLMGWGVARAYKKLLDRAFDVQSRVAYAFGSAPVDVAAAPYGSVTTRAFEVMFPYEIDEDGVEEATHRLTRAGLAVQEIGTDSALVAC